MSPTAATALSPAAGAGAQPKHHTDDKKQADLPQDTASAASIDVDKVEKFDTS